MAKKSSSIKVVIYDVDGTMIDSEPLHVAAWDKALNLQGHTLTDLSEAFRKTMAGKKPIVIAEGMVDELKLPINGSDLLAVKLAMNLQLAPRLIEIMLTSSLLRLASRDHFRSLLLGDQIKQGKPHPETYLKVAEQLGVVPEECVVLEDAATGIQSAKAAGMWCVAVENKYAAPQDTSQADKVTYSLNEITSDLIISLSS